MENIKYYDKLINKRILNYFLQIIADIVLSLIRIVAKNIPLNRKSICIISLHKLGDSIFTFDAINSIKNFYKDNIYLICNEATVPIYELILDRKQIIPLQKSFYRFQERYLVQKARKILSHLKPDIIIDITGVMTSASLIFNSRAKIIYGFNRKIFRSIYDGFSEFNLGNHSREIYTNAIRNYIPIVKFRREHNSYKIFQIEKIAICPFAGWKSKEWSLVKYIQLSELLILNNYDVTMIFDDRELDPIINNYLIDKKIKFIKSKTTEELISHIQNSDLVIGNDSGPIQIAALLGKYTFSIYGPTNPLFHLPEGNSHFLIKKQLPCSPAKYERLCFTDGGKYGCPAFECLSRISVDEVFNEFIKLFTYQNSIQCTD